MPLRQGTVSPQLLGLGVSSASQRIPALAQARTGPGVGPVGGALFDENVDFHQVFKGIFVSLWETKKYTFYKLFWCSVRRTQCRSARIL